VKRARPALRAISLMVVECKRDSGPNAFTQRALRNPSNIVRIFVVPIALPRRITLDHVPGVIPNAIVRIATMVDYDRAIFTPLIGKPPMVLPPNKVKTVAVVTGYSLFV
jgi:hypothetical protein